MELVAATPRAIAHAAELLGEGRLVAFPTETVYGLGADASSDRAVARIFEAKRRPHFNPLIVHVADLAAAALYAELLGQARQLAEAFWPGALTLVLPRRTDARLSLLVSAGLDTVALRVPAHDVAQALLHAAGLPIAAPSANRSGSVSPTRAEHVRDSLDDAVDLILDGGPCPLGLESTVVAFAGGRPVLLRPGGVTVEEIEAVAGPVAMPEGDPAQPQSPGQLASHYAPAKPLRINAATAQPGEAYLAFGPGAPPGVANLSPSGDLREAAAKLFALLRALDRSDARGIAVAPVPETGLGRAINDRLRRAAAPR